MKRYGIERALVSHSLARKYHPASGNRLVSEETRDYPFLYPVWVVMPHHTGEFPDPHRLKEEMREHSIRAVRMYPAESDQNYCLEEWNCGELFGLLEETGAVLLLGLDQITWNQLHELGSRHPGLNIVLTDVTYRVDRNAYPLLEKYPRLFIETSGYKVHRGIEQLCRRFGAARLVFGSGMPLYSGAAAVSLLRYANIGSEERAMIASGNLTELLEGVSYG
jgi:predicted TIM-barrel fold metal-dependent hydrolase